MARDRKEYYKQYYQLHRNECLEYAKIQRETNPEVILERKRRCYDKNKEHYSEYYRQYREQHREQYRENRKQYRKNNPMYCRAMKMAYNNNHRDKLKGIYTGDNVTPSWIVDNIFNGKGCVYCGEQDWRELGCDRINNSKPHTIDNVVCACGKCNVKRHDMRYEIFKILQSPTYIILKGGVTKM